MTGLGTVCIAAALTLSSWQWPSTTLVDRFNVSGIVVANLSVGLSFGEMELIYLANQTNMTLKTSTTFPIEMVIVNTTNPLNNVWIEIEVNVEPGSAIIDTPTLPSSPCTPTDAVVAQCSWLPYYTTSGGYVGQPGRRDAALDQLLLGLQVILDLVLTNDKSCLGTADFVKSLLVDSRTPAPLPLPPPVGMCNLHDNRLAQMLVNIVKSLPVMDLGFADLKIDLGIVSPNVLHGVFQADSFGRDPIALNEHDWIYLPPGFEISLDIDVGHAACPTTNAITIDENLSLLNIRLHNRDSNVPDAIFNGALSQLVSGVMTRILQASLNMTDGRYTLAVPTQQEVQAPMWTMALAIGGCVIIAVGASIASYVAHRDRIVVDKHGNEVSRCRRLLGDAVIVVGACAGILLFAWSNQTTAAFVQIGGELNLYGFSLSNSIQDMWDAELYVLAVCIGVFCGFYPYFKLVVIVVYAVVLQRPQSRVLQVIDTLGKFSLLDSYVMVIMAMGLRVPGVAEVKMLASFWVFLGATLLSITLGNYATHGYRAVAFVNDSRALQFDDDLNDGQRQPNLTAGRFSRSSLLMDAGSPRQRASMLSLSFNPDSPRRFRPVVAGVCFTFVVVLLLLPLLITTVRYEFTGLGAIITGSHTDYSLYRLLTLAPLPLTIVAFATTFVAPVLFTAGFARTRMLAAWCAPDVMLLACLGGLLQLKQFTTFILGHTFAGLIVIDAKLNWPIYTLGAAVAIVLVLILWSVTIRPMK
jgi:hypothetical protein